MSCIQTRGLAYGQIRYSDLTVEGDVIADGVSLKRHAHEGVQPGAGLTGMPQQ